MLSRYKQGAVRFPAGAGIMAILAVTSVVFADSLRNGFVWDDWDLVVNNVTYHAFDLKRIFFAKANALEYLPLKDLSLATDAQLWGTAPFGYHLMNLLLYLAGLVATYSAVRKMALLVGEARAEAVAFWTTLIFALHPLHAEVVNFVTQRNTLLAALFVFLSLNMLLTGMMTQRTLLKGLALAFFLLATFSKAIVVSYPIFLLVLLLYVPESKVSFREKGALLFLFIVTAAAAAWVHVSIASTTGIMTNDLLRFGAGSPVLVIVKALQIPFFYIRMLLAPYPLTVEYGIPFVTGPVVVPALLSMAGLIVLLGAAWLVRRTHPLITLGVVWYFAALVPVLNLFPTHPVVADRYAYLAVFGFALACVGFLQAVTDRRRVAAAVLGSVVVLYGGLSFSRTMDWRSDLTLWQSAVAVDPAIPRANLAEALWKQGRYQEALQTLREENDRSGSSTYSLYEGLFFYQQGKLDDALRSFQRSAAEGGDTNKDVLVALAQTYERKGEDQAALEQYLKAAELKRVGVDSSIENKIRGGIERMQTRFSPRIEALRRAADSSPRGPRESAALAIALHTTGQYDEAEKWYRHTLELDSSNWAMWYNLGLVFMKKNQCADALPCFERALLSVPRNRDILNNAAICQGDLHHDAAAERYFKQALEADPRFFYAVFNLGRLYFRLGNAPQARETLLQARDLASGNRPLQARIDQYLDLLP